MPTYDYECDACGHSFELFQNVGETIKKKCPSCNKMKLQRLIGGGAGFLFKGSGFYTTDYRSESYKSGAAADKPSSCENKNTCDGGGCSSCTPLGVPSAGREFRSKANQLRMLSGNTPISPSARSAVK